MSKKELRSTNVATLRKPPAETVRKVASILRIPARRAEVFLQEAELASPAEYKVVSKLLELRTAGISADSLAALSEGFVVVAEQMVRHPADPLLEVDKPMSRKEKAENLLYARVQSNLIRQRLLEESVTAEEASELAGYSRQNLEDHRRKGHLLAFRFGNQWRYPRWQFAPGETRGVLPGLDKLIQALGLSSVGVAAWITTPNAPLGGRTPLEALRRGRIEPVLRLATEHGRML